jgi:hypothetical protein
LNKQEFIAVAILSTTADLASTDFQALAASNKLNSLSVAQLKAFCKDKNLSMPKKKDELIASVKKHFGAGQTKEE